MNIQTLKLTRIVNIIFLHISPINHFLKPILPQKINVFISERALAENTSDENINPENSLIQAFSTIIKFFEDLQENNESSIAIFAKPFSATIKH